MSKHIAWPGISATESTIGEANTYTVQDILEMTSKKTGLAISEIQSKSRKQEIIKSRRIVVYNIEKLINDFHPTRKISLQKIAVAIGVAKHETVLNTIARAKTDIKTYKEHELYEIIPTN